MSQSVMSKRGGRRKRPRVFTEHGVVMPASVLRSPVAVRASLEVVRAFVRLRSIVGAHRELARRLDDPEQRYDRQFQSLFDAIRGLMEAEEDPPQERIGFRPSRVAGVTPRRRGPARRATHSVVIPVSRP